MAKDELVGNLPTEVLMEAPDSLGWGEEELESGGLGQGAKPPCTIEVRLQFKQCSKRSKPKTSELSSYAFELLDRNANAEPLHGTRFGPDTVYPVKGLRAEPQ